MKPTSLAIFASGSGTNAEAICTTFEKEPDIQAALLICNRKDAGVWKRLERFDIKRELISNEDIEQHSDRLRRMLQQIDFIALAGFLRRLPSELIRAYSRRILNIHPSLLPKYGGLGMYEQHVHKAVLRHRDTRSGISIHQVSEAYDLGPIIFKKSIPVRTDSPEELAHEINLLEREYYPKIIAQEIRKIRCSATLGKEYNASAT